MSCNLNFYLEQSKRCIYICVWNENGTSHHRCTPVMMHLHDFNLTLVISKLLALYQSYRYDTAISFYWWTTTPSVYAATSPVDRELPRASSNFHWSTNLQVVVLTPQGTIYRSRSITAPCIILDVWWFRNKCIVIGNDFPISHELRIKIS